MSHARLASVLVALGLAAPALAASPAFEDPPSLSSVGGVLDVTLEAKASDIEIKNQTITSNVYNGLYVPPVLRLQKGDTLNVEQINNTSGLQLNFHSHGVITSPLGNSDNVVGVNLSPGQSFDTSIAIANENSSGLYWYHAHVHGFVNDAIANGLAGPLIIGDILATFPQLAGITERVMVLKDMKAKKKGAPVADPDPAGKTTRTINGLFKPEIPIAPGELQLWRILNASANIFYDLEMKGVDFNILAVDGNLQNQITTTDELLMPPGRRFEVLVRGPDKPGTYKLKTQKFETGPDGDAYPAQKMAKLKVSKTPVAPIPLPTSGFPILDDLSDESVDVSRTIVFDDTDDPDVFVIDNKVYDENVIDTTVQLGDLEEWRIQNASGEFHVFHIHQGDFQVVSVNGVAQPFTGYQDVVNLPVASESGPGEVVIRIRFDPPIIVGEYVYHCHIVQHEDQGMMANVSCRTDREADEADEPPT
jgi:FtsP/CotA-like multicopper oxidase with cupredoxin domain